MQPLGWLIYVLYYHDAGKNHSFYEDCVSIRSGAELFQMMIHVFPYESAPFFM
jgi:hypothetical protein